MKLVTYAGPDTEWRLGVIFDGYVCDVSRAFAHFGVDHSPGSLPQMRDLLDMDGELFRRLADVHERVRRSSEMQAELTELGLCKPTGSTRIGLPFTPRAVVCTGNNYRDHVDEKAATDITDQKGDDIEFFSKIPECIVGPNDPISHAGELTEKLDYEVELAIVIGREAWKVSRAEAQDCIFGYTVMNDLSARDRQLTTGGCPKLGLSKNFEGCGVIGPCVVTADEFSTPLELDIKTMVNDEIRQHSNTRHMINDPASLISHFSRFFRLKPGYLMATGTVGGTAWSTDAELGGVPYERPDIVRGGYLKPGDTVVCSIQGIGEIRNTIGG